MALKDALERRKRPTRTCRWRTLLESIPPDDAEIASAYMEAGMPVRALIEAMRDESYRVDENAAYRHRRGECSCL